MRIVDLSMTVEECDSRHARRASAHLRPAGLHFISGER
jgi:hypothetical protein